MIVVMRARATEDQIQAVMDRLIEFGFDVHRSTGEEITVIGAVGVKADFDPAQVELLDGVQKVVRVTPPYRLAGRAFRSDATVVDLGRGVCLGGAEVVVMAGPGAVESADQIGRVGAALADAGLRVLGVAAFESRQSPKGFAGLAERNLRLLREAADRYGLLVASEARSVAEISMMIDFVDMIQVGERNMQNDDLLDVLGAARKPVLLKRGAAATLEELLVAADRVLAGGNLQVALCERGVRTCDPSTGDTLDISAIPTLKRLSHLPVLVDSSRVATRRHLVAPIARAAVAAGADGVLIEIHHDPDRALVDGARSLTLPQFNQLTAELRGVASAVGRRLA